LGWSQGLTSILNPKLILNIMWSPSRRETQDILTLLLEMWDSWLRGARAGWVLGQKARRMTRRFWNPSVALQGGSGFSQYTKVCQSLLAAPLG
jgi:hypothetical protein